MRFIGDADQRIREDRLRILRFFRFSARFGEGCSIAKDSRLPFAAGPKLSALSRERVRAEILKLLVAPRAGEVVGVMGERGLLGELLGFADPGRLARLAAIEASSGLAPDGVLRLAALAVLIHEDADRLAERLRLSKLEGERLHGAASALATLHGARAGPPEGALRRLLFRFGRQAALDALMLAQSEADVGPDDAGFLARSVSSRRRRRLGRRSPERI